MSTLQTILETKYTPVQPNGDLDGSAMEIMSRPDIGFNYDEDDTIVQDINFLIHSYHDMCEEGVQRRFRFTQSVSGGWTFYGKSVQNGLVYFNDVTCSCVTLWMTRDFEVVIQSNKGHFITMSSIYYAIRLARCL